MMSDRHIAFVVGARPEFVQVGALIRALPDWNERYPDFRVRGSIVHTGQHYDTNMSGVFFAELGLPKPAQTLGVGSASPGIQTGLMLERLDPVLGKMEPDNVLIFGDTNSTLAGGLAGAKQHMRVGHVESGLRSFNLRMPEEINRRIADHLASDLFCPSLTAVNNLAAEGIRDGVVLTGDVMFESLTHSTPSKAEAEKILLKHGVKDERYGIATIHRAENTKDLDRLHELIGGLSKVAANGLPLIVPLHPRTQKALEAAPTMEGLRTIDPVGHREMLALAAGARVGLTDSGGLQKELYWLGTPCVTLRDETEWVETVEAGWSVLVGRDSDAIQTAVEQFSTGEMPERPQLYGEDGRATDRLLAVLTGADLPDSAFEVTR